jgi:tRNA threonylcarbamoyl adenosine modification protein YeaZ
MIISIETSTSYLSLTLLNKDNVISHKSVSFKNELSEIIVPTIKMFLQENLISLNDVSYLTVGCGPGSFTGIRSIISTALGITVSYKKIKSIGINSLAGLAMSALYEARNLKLKYIFSSVDSKRDDLFFQLFQISDIKKKALPMVAVSDIDTIKIEKLYNYFVINDLNLEDVLYIGHESNIAKKTIEKLNVSKNSIQHPDSLAVGKLASCIILNKLSINKTTFAFDKLKPIYVRSAQINLK